MTRLSNDSSALVPEKVFDATCLEFEFPGIAIGCAEYAEGPTGCTVFHFPAGASLQTDVRGGSPALFAPGWEEVDAICFAGGSLYGLEAAAGVSAELLAMRDYRTGWMDIPLVAGAVIYDFGQRENAVYPDKELGRAALAAHGRASFRSARAARDAQPRLERRPQPARASQPVRVPPCAPSVRRASPCSRS